jgi:hypothetical protein
MSRDITLYVLTCGPLILIIAAWIRIYWERQRRPPHALGLLALGIVSANAAFSAATFLYYEWRPPSHFLPPWQDPKILDLGLLFLLSPIGMILGLIAAVRGAPRWLIWIVEIGSLPLLAVGLMAGAAV